MYQGQAPWDTGRPQPDIIKLAEAGQIRGSVLDVGCGTGENLLYLAARGHEAWGLDFVPVAIERAKAKAAQRGIDAHFIVGNALELKQARQAVRHGDRLRPVPHLHRRGTPGVRQGSCRSAWAWGIAASSYASRTRSLEPRAQGASASRKSGMRSRWMERQADRADPLRVDSTTGWTEVWP